jgi:glycosyltransferase involved in cell wall biosynthesis
MARRWTINGRFLSQPATGVQRYAREVTAALDRLLTDDPDLREQFDIDLVAPPDAEAMPLEAIRFRRAGPFAGHVWEQAVLPRHAPGGLLSLCNTGPLGRRRQIVCIHDMSTRVCPESYAPAFRLGYRVLLPALGRTAAVVSTVSRHSAGELARYGVRRADRIEVIPNGHEHAMRWRPARSETVRRAAGRRPIVLIGSPAPHKNVGLVLGLAGRLAEAGLSVVVVGAADPGVFRRATGAPAENVVWPGRLDDAALAALLADALCLAFPSLSEGFGLPLVEAMALGCPIVSSDRASMPEVCGDAALYAPPDEPETWMRRFLDLAASPSLRDTLRARGLARCRRFSWADAARRYVEAMAQVDAAARPERRLRAAA